MSQLRGRRSPRVVGLPVFALFLVALPAVAAPPPTESLSLQERPRPRDAGIRIGDFATGPANAITDVGGVRVGHATLVVGDSIRTGVTAVVPHDGNVYREPVRAAIVVGNGYGKLLGLSQVQELGVIETPILLTSTLSVWKAADALVDTLLLTPGNERIRSINPVVGETNDGYLSDIRARPVGSDQVRAALRDAAGGSVAEGAIGAGTGTRAFGFKGGIGTASRWVETNEGRRTVGVLVQTNFGGSLVIDGVPIGRRLTEEAPHDSAGGGSIMIVIATDAALDHRHLERLASRSFAGLARTGASFSHGSGDYAIAFSTDRGPIGIPRGGTLSRLFMAVADATEEAIVASLFAAETTRGHNGVVAGLPVARVLELMQAAGALESHVQP